MLDFKIVHLPVLRSTNEHMQFLIEAEEQPEGLVVTADEQLMGRGHGGNRWVSERGKNLLMSLLLKPSGLMPSAQFLLTAAVSLALTETLHEFLGQGKVQIKWPNDIYVDQRKISGILIQNTIRGREILYSIIGIGLNVNQAEFPPGLPNPVSMKQLTGVTVNRDEVLQVLLQSIAGYYSRLLDKNNHRVLMDSYCNRLFRFREWATYHDGQEFKAMITGISEYGQLQLSTSEGELRQYGFKEVEYIL